MTEASPVTHSPFVAGPWAKLGSIGPCVPNTECKVVDVATGAELDANEQGELWIRGPQVMQGYLNRPEETARTITPDGWLRTGDIGYADADGDFFIVDRLKELIKYKAYQVAPAELEAVLLSHPAVADAAVIPSPDEEAGEVPKAFVVLQGRGDGRGSDGVRRGRVAPYKKVRRLEFVAEIPKSPSGKILRRVLVERERAALAQPVLSDECLRANHTRRPRIRRCCRIGDGGRGRPAIRRTDSVRCGSTQVAPWRSTGADGSSSTSSPGTPTPSAASR